jgi:7,8-dihydro-6-hydroxymethylpterin-pyrophosphokinase
MKPLHLPHADILKYAHAVVPLAELAPDLLHPETGQRLGEIASKFLATAEPPLIRKVIPEVTADSGSGDKL